MQFPGVSNAWTMPIKARIDMLSTGIRTPVGIKVLGTDLVEMEKLARQIETVVKAVPGTSSAYAERVIGGYYLDIAPNREALARYGLMVSDVQDTMSSALGGETITTTVEGRERYRVNLRYPRDLRSDPQSIARDVLVPMPGGGTVPLGEVAGDQAHARTDLDPHRERPTCGLHLRRYPRPRSGRLRRRRQGGGGRQRQVSAGQLRRLERSVRISGARHRASSRSWCR